MVIINNLKHISTKRVEAIAIILFLVGIFCICAGFFILLKKASQIEPRCWDRMERQGLCTIKK